MAGREITETSFKPSNSEIYAPPRNWEVACAITQMKAGVVLTEGQEAMLEQVRKEA